MNLWEIFLFVHSFIPLPSNWKGFLDGTTPGFKQVLLLLLLFFLSPFLQRLCAWCLCVLTSLPLQCKATTGIPKCLADFELSSKESKKPTETEILTNKRCELPESKVQSREQERGIDTFCHFGPLPPIANLKTVRSKCA